MVSPGGTKDVFVAALANSAIYGVLDLLSYALSNPVDALIYIAIVTVAARFAFRAWGDESTADQPQRVAR